MSRTKWCAAGVARICFIVTNGVSCGIGRWPTTEGSARNIWLRSESHTSTVWIVMRFELKRGGGVASDV
jgi:hypothetical protein